MPEQVPIESTSIQHETSRALGVLAGGFDGMMISLAILQHEPVLVAATIVPTLAAALVVWGEYHSKMVPASDAK